MREHAWYLSRASLKTWRKVFQNQVLISRHTHLPEQIEDRGGWRSDDSVLMWLRKSFTVVRTTFLTLSSSALFCSRHQHLILLFLHSPYTSWHEGGAHTERETFSACATKKMECETINQFGGSSHRKKVVSSLTGATRTRKLDRERDRESRKKFHSNFRW